MDENVYPPSYEANALKHFRHRFLPAAIYLLAAAVLVVIVKGMGI